MSDEEELITETTDLDSCDVHSDAGGVGYSMACPNCDQSITLANGSWWETDCKCGVWQLEVKAKLYT
ncbi:MAG: hypothetical protein V3U78_05375 [Thiotrichaceae bacterium]